ncbi:hypothetical protein [Sinorhizobium fredii]|uniref:hypothetical protein n=1 Tax=Rhizobium fredii TaxID=380 RepID=UPI003516D488
MSFYAAKVVRADGSRSKLITVFAEDDDDARRKVLASPLARCHATIHVASISDVHREEFGRWYDDNGVVEHTDFQFTDDGPINPITLFGQRRD